MAERTTPDQLEALHYRLALTGYGETFSQYVLSEADADMLLFYDSLLIPGPLQTRSYAEARIEANGPHLTPEQRAARLDLRMYRQQLMARRGVLQNYIIPLDVLEHLHDARHTDVTARKQLNALAHTAGRDTVDIRVIGYEDTLRSGVGMAPLAIAQGPNLADPIKSIDTAFIEDSVDGWIVSGEGTIPHTNAFEILGRFAMESDASRAVLNSLVR